MGMKKPGNLSLPGLDALGSKRLISRGGSGLLR